MPAANILTTAEAADQLGVSARRVRQFCRAGRLEAQKIGRDWIVLQADLNQFKSIPRKPGRSKETQNDRDNG